MGWAIGPIWKRRIHLERSLSGKWSHLFQGGMLKLTAPEVKESLDFFCKNWKI